MVRDWESFPLETLFATKGLNIVRINNPMNPDDLRSRWWELFLRSRVHLYAIEFTHSSTDAVILKGFRALFDVLSERI